MSTGSLSETLRILLFKRRPSTERYSVEVEGERLRRERFSSADGAIEADAEARVEVEGAEACLNDVEELFWNMDGRAADKEEGDVLLEGMSRSGIAEGLPRSRLSVESSGVR